MGNSPSAAPRRAAIVLRAPRSAAVPLRQRRADLGGGRRRAAGGWRLLGRSLKIPCPGGVVGI